MRHANRYDELNQNPELHRLARAVHMHPEELVEHYDETRQQVRHLHNDIYYRPMLPISATSPDESVALSEEATLERYEAIGFADPQAALRHVRALTDGVTRAAKINRILLPAVLRWLGEGQNPDMGLLPDRRCDTRREDQPHPPACGPALARGRAEPRHGPAVLAHP